MKNDSRENKIFESLLKIAAEEALRLEMDALPSCEELNAQFKPSPETEKNIRKIILRQRTKSRITDGIKAFGKTAAVFAVFFAVVATVLLNVDASRNYIFNTIIRWQEDHTAIRFENAEERGRESGVYMPEYIPEGFAEVQNISAGDNYFVLFQNDEGTQIIFGQNPAESNFFADNEQTVFIETEINGNEAYIFKAEAEGEKSNLIWKVGNIVFTINSALDESELIRIAESVPKK